MKHTEKTDFVDGFDNIVKGLPRLADDTYSADFFLRFFAVNAAQKSVNAVCIAVREGEDWQNFKRGHAFLEKLAKKCDAQFGTSENWDAFFDFDNNFGFYVLSIAELAYLRGVRDVLQIFDEFGQYHGDEKKRASALPHRSNAQVETSSTIILPHDREVEQ